MMMMMTTMNFLFFYGKQTPFPLPRTSRAFPSLLFPIQAFLSPALLPSSVLYFNVYVNILIIICFFPVAFSPKRADPTGTFGRRLRGLFPGLFFWGFFFFWGCFLGFSFWFCEVFLRFPCKYCGFLAMLIRLILLLRAFYFIQFLRNFLCKKKRSKKKRKK